MTVEELKALLEQIAEQCRLAVREMAGRELALALATDTDLCYEIDQLAQPLLAAGEAVGDRLTRIRAIGRSLDALNDPATITEVR